MKLKQLLLIAVVALWAPVTLMAQNAADTVAIGYCDGEYSKLGCGKTFTGDGWSDVAVRIPAGQLQALAGNAVTQVRAALSARTNIDTLRVWLRHSLDGPNLAQGTKAAGIASGFNEIELDAPLELTAEAAGQDLFIGYSMHQKKSINAISMRKDLTGYASTSYIRLNGGEWEDMSATGVFCVEALVVGNNIPGMDLSLDKSLVYLSDDGATINFSSQVTNVGGLAARGFKIWAQHGAAAVVLLEQDFAQQVSMGRTVTAVMSMPNEWGSNPDADWTLTVAPLAGDEQNTGNNSTVAHNVWLRNVLLEEFTTEPCPNCPRVANALRQVLEQEPYSSRVTAVSHHSAYYTDKYTQPCDTSYLWLFNEGGTVYAPALMFDRVPMFQSSYASGQMTPTYTTSSATVIQGLLDTRLAEFAHASIELDVARYGSRAVVTATVRKGSGLESQLPHLNLQVTEDSIYAPAQMGTSSRFYHMHLTRAYNSTWGEPVVWDADGTFTCQWTAEIGEQWNAEQLKVVAWLYNYNPQDKLDCEVANAVTVAMPAATPALPGDLNLDQSVDSQDLALLIQALLGEATAEADGDLNGDGVLDAQDVSALVNLIMGN